MDKIALREASDRLDKLLRLYSPSNKNADLLYRQLSHFIFDASAGAIELPIDLRQIPGGRIFDETDLRDLPGLESAFAKFKRRLTGGENEDSKEVRRLFEARHGRINPQEIV